MQGWKEAGERESIGGIILANGAKVRITSFRDCPIAGESHKQRSHTQWQGEWLLDKLVTLFDAGSQFDRPVQHDKGAFVTGAGGREVTHLPPPVRKQRAVTTSAQLASFLLFHTGL